jgi:2-methylcitrate dehydratase PrpD
MARKITTELAGFCAGLALADMPRNVQVRAKHLVLDLFGNILRARHEAESTPALLDAARALGLAEGRFTVLGDAAGWSAAGAALLNGALAHSLDFDDTHAAGSLHPGAPVIPAALAAAEMVGADGATTLAAIVAGYEVTCRLALALPAGDHYDRGFHPTATCGAFGAAVAAGRVFGLSAAQMEHAFGIALSQAAGSLQFLTNGAWTKRFQVGWSGMAGLTAATLARQDFTGAAAAIEGKHGFLHAYAPAPKPERVMQDVGTVWELMHTAVKPYPSCRYGHAVIDAAIALHNDLGLKPHEVERATVGLPAKGMLLVGAPVDKKANPQNVVDGQFSGPFVVATGLATGAMGWDSYAHLSNPEVRALLPKITCEQDPEIEAEFPTNMSGKLTLVARGETFVRKVVVPKGEPDNFLTPDELRGKFHGLADAVIGAARAAQLADAVAGFERAPDMASLLRHAAPAAPTRLAGE